jgi:hypothetical protein
MPVTWRRFLALLAVFALSAFALSAAPNFSGEWKLNSAKSDFGEFPGPEAMSQTVNHQEPSLKVATKMSTPNGEFDWEASYTTDGKECINEFGPGTMKSVLKWDGDTLVIESKGNFGDSEVMMADKWALSGDGKTLTVQRHFSSSRGEMDQKIVLDKQ